MPGAAGARSRRDLAARHYFRVRSGGLKLREENPGRPHLIQFERAIAPWQRESRYRIIMRDEPDALCAALTDALGARVTVVKRRRLFLWRGVRIHLDRVERLGTFIELEAAASQHSDLSHEHELVAELRERLAITDERLVARGYAEQLLGADGAPTRARRPRFAG